MRIKDEQNKIYHVDWSPDSQFLAFSRGPDSGGDPTKPGTHQAAAEIHGVYAKGWNICVVKVDRAADLQPGESDRSGLLHAHNQRLQQQGAGVVPAAPLTGEAT